MTIVTQDKIKIGFNPLKIWDEYDHFRQFIYALKNNNNFKLTVISDNNYDIDIIDNINIHVGTDNIVIPLNNNINNPSIQEIAENYYFYFSSDIEFNNLINEYKRINNIKGKAIFVNTMYDFYNLEMKYIKAFKFYLELYEKKEKEC